MAEAKEKLT